MNRIGKTPKIAVICDIIIEVNYISDKQPTHIVHNEPQQYITNNNNFTYVLGGATNVVEGLQNLECDVVLFGVVGNDFYGEKVIELLNEKNIKNCIFIDEKLYTTQKHRRISGDNIISQFNIENKVEIDKNDQNRVINTIINSDVDVIILCDYGKGGLTDYICSSLIKYANENGVYTFVDTKTQSYNKYRGCYCFIQNIQNLYEDTNFIECSLDDTKCFVPMNIEDTIIKLKDITRCNNFILKNRIYGLYTVFNDPTKEQSITKSIKYTENIEKDDVAIDSDIIVIILVYVFMINGRDIQQAAEIANYFSTKLRDTKITKKELMTYVYRKYINVLNGDNNTYLYPIYPSVLVRASKLREICTKSYRNIVFTSGCFDILNSAHLRLINHCQKFGDILVVALNTDSSIQRLKGKTYPINNIHERMLCLREIGKIDYIFSFDEDTPINLIRELQPDVIVKGGNYSKEEVVGKEYTKHVEIFSYIDGISTKNTIKSIMTNVLL